MSKFANKKSYKRIALVLSLFALIVWSLLGTGASLAWFSDVSEEVNNIFHFANFDLAVSHELTDGTWKEIDSQTKVFDEEALYEPGYIQVIYLKVENKGSREFEFYTAVNVNGCTVAKNVFGQKFMLQDYLKFGVTLSSTEQGMKQSVSTREKAAKIANMPLHNYDTTTAVLKPGETSYLALVVHMEKEIDNVANYRGDDIPKVELGITVKADQVRN